ncbi:MAG: peptidylprolyl isomerase [Cryobacterium sp.]
MAQHHKQEREAREERDRLRGYQARRAVNFTQHRRRVRDNIIAGVGLVVVLGLLVGAQVYYFSAGPGATDSASSEETADSAAEPIAETGTETPLAGVGQNSGDVPPLVQAEARPWTGTLTLNGVPMGIELDGARAPQAVASTVSLVRSGFYDGVSCHRLTTGGFFVLQCGDPDGDGSGGPGYAYGPIENAPADDLYPAGTLAMARQGDNAFSQGSQFFLVYSDTTIPADLAGGYSVVGRVTSGLDDVRAAITDSGVENGVSDGAPAVPTTITAVTVQ